jgi:hypothetical protein
MAAAASPWIVHRGITAAFLAFAVAVGAAPAQLTLTAGTVMVHERAAIFSGPGSFFKVLADCVHDHDELLMRSCRRCNKHGLS